MLRGVETRVSLINMRKSPSCFSTNERQQRSGLVKGLLALAAASVVLFLAPVRAEAQGMPFPPPQTVQWTGGLGVFVGYAMGARPGVEWGFELFATRLTRPHLTNCDDGSRAGFGPLAQLAVVGTRHPRITLALQGGGQLASNGAALTGAIGGTFRGGEDPGFGIHLAAMPEFNFFSVAGQTELLLDDYAVVGGLRMLPTYGYSFACVVE